MSKIKVDNTEFDPKYIVFKVDDARKHLTIKEQLNLNSLMRKIAQGREDDGKTPNNTYLIIKTDEVYASEVAEIMKEHGHYKEVIIDEHGESTNN